MDTPSCLKAAINCWSYGFRGPKVSVVAKDVFTSLS